MSIKDENENSGLEEDFDALENEEFLDVNDNEETEETNEGTIEEGGLEIDDTKKGDTDFEKVIKSTANKHKLEGTHTLKRDTILMGKKEEEDEEFSASTEFFDNTYNIERGSAFDYETNYNEDYTYKKELIKDIYDILDEKTEIDFLVNRRKPNKSTFNSYYEMCITDLSMKYSRSEIFVELSYYFTDNIFNMFKLLNKKNASGIIFELKEKGYLTDIGNINFI